MELEEIILVKRSVIVDGFSPYYKGVSGLDSFLQEEMRVENNELNRIKYF